MDQIPLSIILMSATHHDRAIIGAFQCLQHEYYLQYAIIQLCNTCSNSGVKRGARGENHKPRKQMVLCCVRVHGARKADREYQGAGGHSLTQHL